MAAKPAPNITARNQDNSIGIKYNATANQTDRHKVQSNGLILCAGKIFKACLTGGITTVVK